MTRKKGLGRMSVEELPLEHIPQPHINVRSVIGGHSQDLKKTRPLVQLQADGKDICYLPPAKAIQVALMLVDAALAAECDSTLVGVLRAEGIARESIAQMFLTFARERQALEHESAETDTIRSTALRLLHTTSIKHLSQLLMRYLVARRMSQQDVERIVRTFQERAATVSDDWLPLR